MRNLFDSMRARFLALSTGVRAAVLALVAVVALCATCTVCSGAIAALNAGSSTPSSAAHQGSSSTSGPSSTPKATAAQPTATPKPAAKSVLKLSGTGEKQSSTFHVNGQWKLTYHCDNSTSLETVPFYVNVYNSDGSATLDSVSLDCPKGGVSDETVIHDGGDKYLKILAMSPWSLEVVDIP